MVLGSIFTSLECYCKTGSVGGGTSTAADDVKTTTEKKDSLFSLRKIRQHLKYRSCADTKPKIGE